MEGLLLLSFEPYAAGARDSEKTFNPNTTEVKVLMNGILIKVFSQGMKTGDMWKEVFGRFKKEKSAMNVTDFYAGDRVSLFNDRTSMRDNDYLGSGLKLMNTKEGV